MATNENLPPRVVRALAKELKSLDESPPEDIRVHVNDDNFSSITADIDGPPGTPYELGVFRIRLVLGPDFPQTPPKGYFVTKVFHPNISKTGEICVNVLKKDWKPTLGLRHVLVVIRCLLIEPFPESALNEDAGKLLMEDYEGYAKHARLLTSIHAIKPKPKAAKVAIAESTAVNAQSSSNSDKDHVPLTVNTANMDSSSTACGTTCPSKKAKSDTAASKAAAELKKKMDARKKSLKRL